MSKPVPEQVRELEGRIRRLERTATPPGGSIFSSGCEPLDAALPVGGFVAGRLVEWLDAVPGGGATRLALQAVRQACGMTETPANGLPSDRQLVVIDPQGCFYPPAAWAAGVDLQRTAIVRPRTLADQHWAAHEALRCPGVGAVLWWPDRLDDRQFRRLQLAAESAEALGFFIRPARTQREPSWADVRILVQPLRERGPRWSLHTGGATDRRRLRLTLVRARGITENRTLDLEWDDEANALRLAPPLVAPEAPVPAIRLAGAGRGGF